MKKKLLALFLFPFLLLSGCNKKGQEEESPVTPPTEQYINVSVNEVTIEEDSTYQIETEIIKKGTIIFYSSANEEIATVNDDGLVTAIKAGETFITIRGGKDSYIVDIKVTSFQAKNSLQIVLTKDSFVVAKDDTYVLPLTVKLGNQVIDNATLSYTYSVDGVVSIDNLTLTALSVGEVSCVVTASYQSFEASKVFSVTVYQE